jgi:hypothetical protein
MRPRKERVPTIPREFFLRRVVMFPITKFQVPVLTIFKTQTVLERKKRM